MGMRHLNIKSRSFSCCGSLHAFACQLVTSSDDRALFRPTCLHAEKITVDLLKVVLSFIELADHSDAPNCDKCSGVPVVTHSKRKQVLFGRGGGQLQGCGRMK